MTHKIAFRFFLSILLIALQVYSGGCSGKSEPKVELWEDGNYRSIEIETYKIAGKRDGAVTRVSAGFTLETGEQLQVELEVRYDPQPELGASRWMLGGNGAGEGKVTVESLKFLGGQGEGPSLGGRFRLEENGSLRFRVTLPLRPVDQPRWTVD